MEPCPDRYLPYVATTVRPGDEEPDALGQRTTPGCHPMPEAAQQATPGEMQHDDALKRVLDEELPRYAEALRRLAE